MNRIHKVIYCKATQTFVAVSELAKSRGKSQGRKTRLEYFSLKQVAVAVLIGLGLVSTTVSAQFYVNQGNTTTTRCAVNRSNSGTFNGANNTYRPNCDPSDAATQTNRIIFFGNDGSNNNTTENASFGGDVYVNGSLNMGDDATIDMGDNVVNGVATGVADTDAVNVGQLNDAVEAAQTHYFDVNSTGGGNYNNDGATGTDAIAIGKSTTATDDQAVAVGYNANAQSSQSVAIGSGAKSAFQSSAIGNDTLAAGDGSIAMGSDDSGSSGYSTDSTIGGRGVTSGNYRATTTYGSGSTAIASHAQALSKGSTAIGVGATAGDGGVSTSGTWSNADSNIEATAIGASSYASAEQSTAIGASSQATDKYAVAIGYDARATNEGAVALGEGARASGEDGYALGADARARGENSIALGTGAAAGASTGTATSKLETIAIGNNTQAYASQAITIGSDIKTSGDYGIAIGSNASARKVDSTGYAGVAIGSGGANEGASANGESSIAIGGGNKSSSGLDGAVATGDNSVSLGSGSSATLDDSVALGSKSVANTASGIAGYDPTTGNTSTETSSTWVSNAAAVSVGNGTTTTRQITSVAAGTQDTDAVNVAQLKAASQPWKLRQTGGADNEINPTDTVEFENGTYTTATVTNEASGVTKIKYDITADKAKLTFAGDSGTSDVNLGGTYTIKGTADEIVTTDDGAGALTIKLADKVKNDIAEGKTIVTGGTNIAGVDATGGTNGTPVTYTVNANGTTASAGSSAVTVTAGIKDGNNVTDYAVDLSQDTKDAIAAGKTVVTAGANTKVTKTAGTGAAPDSYVVDAEDTTVTAGSSYVSVGETLTTGAGIDDYKIDVSQDVKDAAEAVKEGLTFTGDSGSTNEELLGSSIAVNGDSNITTSASGDAITVKLNEDITVTSVTANKVTVGAVSIDNTNGINAGNKAITNVASGGTTTTNAANIGDVQTAVAASAWNIAGNDKTAVGDGVNADEQVNFLNGNATTVTVAQDGDSYTVKYDVDTDNTTIKVEGDKLSAVTDGFTATSGKISANTEAALATSGDIANAINKSGFTLTSSNKGTSTNVSEEINPSDTVTINGNSDAVKVTQSGGTVSIDVDTNNINLSYSANNGTDQTVSLADGLDFNNGTNGNITASVDANGEVTHTLNKNITVTSVTTDSIAVGNTVNISSTGIDAGNTVISNVKAGVADTDAVNVSQLNSSVAAATTEVASSTNTSVTTATGASGQTIYTVDAEDTTVTAGSSYVTVADNLTDSTADNAGVDNYSVDLSDDTKQILTDADKGFNIGADNGADDNVQLTETINFTSSDDSVTTTVSDNEIDFAVDTTNVNLSYSANGGADQSVSLADGLDFNNGTNTTATVDASGKVIYSLNDSINLTQVTTGDTVMNNAGITLSNGANNTVQLTNNGLNNGGNQITNVASGGTTTTNAANIGDVQTAVAASAWNIAGNNKTAVGNGVNANEQVSFLNGNATTVTVAQDGDNYTVKYDVDTDNTTIKVEGDKLSAVTDGFTATGGKISADTGTALATSGDIANAINKSGFTLTSSNKGTSTNVSEEINPSDTVTINGNSDAVKVTQSGSTVSIDVDTNNINLSYSANDGTDQTVSLADGLDFNNGTNTTATVAADGEVTYSLNDSIDLTQVTTGDTVMNNDGITLSNGANDTVYLTNNGLDNGGNKITNVAAGTDDTDAVNVSQLKASTAAAKTEVVAGTNIASVDESTGANGQTVYTVNANGTTASAGSGYVIVNESDAGGNVTDYSLDVSDEVKKATDSVLNDGLTFTGDSGSTNEELLGSSVAITGDSNITTSAAGDTVNISLNDDISVDTVTTDSINIGNTVSIDASGINAGNTQITDVASGLGGRSLDDIKAEGNTANEWNNVATVGDLTQVQGDVNNIYQVIGGQNTDGNAVDADGNTLTDADGNPISANQALKTYDVSGQTATDNNTVISAIKNMNEGGIKYFHTNDDSGQKIGGAVANTDDSSASGAYSTAIGYQASSTAENAIAIGNGSQAVNRNTIAIGTGNVVSGENSGAIGDPNTVSGDGSYALGNDNTVATDKTFVVGNKVTETLENSVILGDSSAAITIHTTATGGNYTYQGANDANVSGVNDVVGVVSVGKDGQTRQIQNVAAGVVAADSTDAINGSQLYWTNQAVADNASDIVTNASNIANNAGDIVVNAGKIADNSDKITINTGNIADNSEKIATNTDNITNNANNIQANRDEISKGLNFSSNEGGFNRQLGETVAIGGGLDSEADASSRNIRTAAADGQITLLLSENPEFNSVTVEQGLVVNEGATVNMGNNRVQNVAAGVNATDAVNVSQLAGAYQQINEVNQKANAGIAAALATAAISQPYEPGGNTFGVSVGTYEGQQAISVGVSTISDNGKWTIKGALTQDTQSNTGAAVGVNYNW